MMNWNIQLVHSSVEVEGEFPSTRDEADAWKAKVAVVPLSSTVIAVANTRIEGKWKAYIDSVEGKNHEEEWKEVRCRGARLRENIARAIFPCFARIPYAR